MDFLAIDEDIDDGGFSPNKWNHLRLKSINNFANILYSVVLNNGKFFCLENRQEKNSKSYII